MVTMKLPLLVSVQLFRCYGNYSLSRVDTGRQKGMITSLLLYARIPSDDNYAESSE